MPLLTLNQAAREAGKSKATILDAIRNGRLTAPKDEQGRYQIDPAELFRVWPQTIQPPDTETETDPAPTMLETALLRQQVAFLERILQGSEDERNDLRRRLDAESAARESAAAEIRRLTQMITQQSEPKAEIPPAKPEIERQPESAAKPKQSELPYFHGIDTGIPPNFPEPAFQKVSLYEKLWGCKKA